MQLLLDLSHNCASHALMLAVHTHPQHGISCWPVWHLKCQHATCTPPTEQLLDQTVSRVAGEAWVVDTLHLQPRHNSRIESTHFCCYTTETD